MRAIGLIERRMSFQKIIIAYHHPAQLKGRGPNLHPPLRRPSTPPQSKQRGHIISKKKKRRKLSDKELTKVINALDCSYKMHEVCGTFNIPKNILRTHDNEKIKRKKDVTKICSY